jgi:hypothetical protein
MRLAYSVALVLLMEYSRQSRDRFEFGPWDLQALEDHGLVVSGPDVSGARKILSEIPGLYESDD